MVNLFSKLLKEWLTQASCFWNNFVIKVKLVKFNYFPFLQLKRIANKLNKQHFFLSNFSKVELFESQNSLINRCFGPLIMTGLIWTFWIKGPNLHIWWCWGTIWVIATFSFFSPLSSPYLLLEKFELLSSLHYTIINARFKYKCARFYATITNPLQFSLFCFVVACLVTNSFLPHNAWSL